MVERGHFDFEAVSAGDATGGVYNDDLLARVIIDLRKHEAYGKLLIDVRDPGAGPLACEHKAAGTTGALEINIANVFLRRALSSGRPRLFSMTELVRRFKHPFEACDGLAR
ncbi:hypothetical protein GCM10007857_75700 [Bradyrhizobium iriomotense]|uniref:Uncharacterized protein n=1 Tax=Bradyrhizobium iriomotense TaxID=441950 RepID=A0ABQ6B8Y6_9BRAD|nr:hypothetical protein GCM10007857_75700 [Bradyrhizobium iriomotense]